MDLSTGHCPGVWYNILRAIRNWEILKIFGRQIHIWSIRKMPIKVVWQCSVLSNELRQSSVSRVLWGSRRSRGCWGCDDCDKSLPRYLFGSFHFSHMSRGHCSHLCGIVYHALSRPSCKVHGQGTPWFSFLCEFRKQHTLALFVFLFTRPYKKTFKTFLAFNFLSSALVSFVVLLDSRGYRAATSGWACRISKACRTGPGRGFERLKNGLDRVRK